MVIKQGTDPWFWKEQVKWTSSRGSDTVGGLTGFCISAIGQSGRPDAAQIIERFKTKDMVNRIGGEDPAARNFSGAVVEAAFNNDMIRQYGMEAFRSNFFTENQGKLYDQWEKSENGEKWKTWYQSVRRQR